MAALVYIAWCEPEPQARLYIRAFKFDQTPSSVCIRLYKQRASIFYFFYKIRLGNMLWRHNRVCIAWYKHGNSPITACVKRNLFHKVKYLLKWYVLSIDLKLLQVSALRTYIGMECHHECVLCHHSSWNLIMVQLINFE